MFLTDKEILRQIQNNKMIEDYGSLDDQLQPNGFDFRLGRIYRIDDDSYIEISTKTKIAANLLEIHADYLGNMLLTRGPYLVQFAETVNIPINVLGLGRPRSTLCRNGISLHTGVWDAGYSGKSTALLVVHAGTVILGKDTRIMQMVFGYLDNDVVKTYNGQYQNENIPVPELYGSDVYGNEVYI